MVLNNVSDIEDVISLESPAKLAYSIVETKLRLPESLRKEEP